MRGVNILHYAVITPDVCHVMMNLHYITGQKTFTLDSQQPSHSYTWKLALELFFQVKAQPHYVEGSKLGQYVTTNHVNVLVQVKLEEVPTLAPHGRGATPYTDVRWSTTKLYFFPEF